MFPSSFYGSNFENIEYTRLRDACERAERESSRVRNIVGLPPKSGDKDVESDVKDAPEKTMSDDEQFEATVELEVDESSKDEDF